MWRAALDPIHTMGNSTGRTASIPQQRDFKGKNKVEGECVDYKNLSDVLKNFSWLTKTMLSKYVLLGYKATKKCKGVFDIKIGA